jgi:hypothetical protein
MVGGGFANNGHASWTLDAFYPSASNAWSVHYHSSDPHASSADVAATALCVTFARPIQTAIVTGALAALVPNTSLPDATCPTGYGLLSGGYFYTNQGTLGPGASSPPSLTAWRVAADSEAQPGGFTSGEAYALCGRSAIRPVTGNDVGAANLGPPALYLPGCPSGAYAIGSGFTGGPASVVNSGPMYDSGSGAWSFSGSQNLTAWPVCAQFLLQG